MELKDNPTTTPTRRNPRTTGIHSMELKVHEAYESPSHKNYQFTESIQWNWKFATAEIISSVPAGMNPFNGIESWVCV